jgi:hypothetical protein
MGVLDDYDNIFPNGFVYKPWQSCHFLKMWSLFWCIKKNLSGYHLKIPSLFVVQ